MLNNFLFVDCMTMMTVGLTMGWIGLGRNLSGGLGWVLKSGPTAMSAMGRTVKHGLQRRDGTELNRPEHFQNCELPVSGGSFPFCGPM